MTTETRALAAFAAALIAALVLTPIARRIALRYRIMAQPTNRGMHKKPVPYLGGLALLAAVVIGAIFCEPSLKLVGLLLGATAIALVGAADDIWEMSPLVKLVLSVGAVLALFPFGIIVPWIDVPGHGYQYLGPWAKLITLFWVVLLIHATNFIDGMDGQAAGLSGIAALAFVALGLMWLRVPSNPDAQADIALVAVLAAAVAGACAGFLRYNFNPARIFMGDAGAMCLGLLLAGMAIVGLFKTLLLCLVAPIALGIPILDAAWAVVRRTAAGQPAYRPDRKHIHHRLVDAGFSPRGAVLVLYLVAALLAVAAVILGSPR